MALEAKVGAFETGTGALNSTIPVTGVGFQPKALIFWWSRAIGTTDAISAVSCGPGIGFATSTTARCAFTAVAEDASISADTNKVFYNSACVALFDALTGLDGLLDVQSLDSDGFTLVVDDVFATSYRIHYLALGGSDITNATVATRAIPAAAGNEAVTGLGFQPSVVLFAACRTTASGTIGNNAEVGFGAAISSTKRGVVGVIAPNGQATMDSGRYGFDAECVMAGGTGTPPAISGRADFVSRDADGFTLNWTEITTGTYGYLAIAGGNWNIGTLLTQTDTTTDIVVSGLGFQPSAALFFSHNTTKSVIDTPNDHWSSSVGAFSSLSARGAQATWYEDATADSETAVAVEHDSVYARISATDTIDGLMDVTAIGTDGFTCRMTDADPTQAFVWYLAAGNPASAASVFPPFPPFQNAVYRM